MELKQIISAIQPLNQATMDEARNRQNLLTKPPGSLGKLETISIQMAGITGNAVPSINHKVVITMAGDHGVVAEGISAYPAEVTTQMVLNFLAGGAAINVLAEHVGARVVIVDMGVAAEFDDHPNLARKKVAPGTNNIAREQAMSEDQAHQCIQAGIEIFEAEYSKGADILITGDMGIGNTTPSAAIACAITGINPSLIVGRGTGIDDQGLERKIETVKSALAINKPDSNDGFDILMKVGGFEIGGLVGTILAAASHQVPIVIDGFISTAAAMIAVTISPLARHYLFSAHRSQELGHQVMLAWLELDPLLSLHLRLGEGTGAALAVGLIDAACKILSEMATFEEAGVSNKD